MAANHHDSPLRLSDLRRAQPADATLENLLTTLSGKIQSCSRLAVFAYEAGTEGHAACASAFRELADVERESFKSLLICLREYLDDAWIGLGYPDADVLPDGPPMTATTGAQATPEEIR